jgi:hypothetical protein
MRYTRVLIASALVVMFGSAVACPGDKAKEQTPSGTVSKPLAPKPSA